MSASETSRPRYTDLKARFIQAGYSSSIINSLISKFRAAGFRFGSEPPINLIEEARRARGISLSLDRPEI